MALNLEKLLPLEPKDGASLAEATKDAVNNVGLIVHELAGMTPSNHPLQTVLIKAAEVLGKLATGRGDLITRMSTVARLAIELGREANHSGLPLPDSLRNNLSDIYKVGWGLQYDAARYGVGVLR